MHNKRLSVFSPYSVDNNSYVENVKKIIESCGISLISLRDCLKSPYKILKCQSINLNWYERAENLREYVIKSLVLNLFWLLKKDIIYTIHNKVPHNLRNQKYSLKLMKKLARKSRTIIGLCGDTKEVLTNISHDDVKKLIVIPLPNYLSNYELLPVVKNYREQFLIGNDELVITYFGNISPYKNVELLIDAFIKSEIPARLLIIGKPSNEIYQNQLLEKIPEDKKINSIIDFIPDKLVPSIFAASSIMVFPFDTSSSLNSASIILSYTMKKTVIAPLIGTINDQGDHSFLYTYDYKTKEEHISNLMQKFKEVYDDFCINPNILVEKGKQAYDYVIKYHDIDCIRQKYDQIYNGKQ